MAPAYFIERPHLTSVCALGLHAITLSTEIGIFSLAFLTRWRQCRLLAIFCCRSLQISLLEFVDIINLRTKDIINRINKTLPKAKRYGFCSKLYTFNELLEHYDDRVFSRMAFSNHCLHHLLEPDSSTSQMTLRTRGHSFNLPRFHFDLTKKSFIFRSLYGFI